MQWRTGLTIFPHLVTLTGVTGVNPTVPLCQNYRACALIYSRYTHGYRQGHRYFPTPSPLSNGSLVRFKTRHLDRWLHCWDWDTSVYLGAIANDASSYETLRMHLDIASCRNRQIVFNWILPSFTTFQPASPNMIILSMPRSSFIPSAILPCLGVSSVWLLLSTMSAVPGFLQQLFTALEDIVVSRYDIEFLFWSNH